MALLVTGFAASSTTAAPTAKTTMTAPCERAKTAKLNSGFTCDLVWVPRAKVPAIKAKIAAAPSMEAALASETSLAPTTTLAVAAGGEGGSCSLTGCYQWFSTTHSGYDAVGSYGWRYSNGAYQRIGIISIEIDDYLTGAYSTKVQPFCWGTDHSAPNQYMIGEMYYATTGGANGPLATPRKKVSTVATVLSNTKRCFTTYLNDNTRAIYTTYHFIRWGAAGFYGHWYAYNKNWIYYKPTAGTYLRYFSPVKYPYYANGAGWLNY